MESWFTTRRDQLLGPLVELAQLAGDGRGQPGVSRAARGLVVQLVEALGCRAREGLAAQVAALTRPDRAKLAAAGVRIGQLSLHIPALLRPEPTRWRLALWAVARNLDAAPAPPPAGAVTLAADPAWPEGWLDTAGYWRAGRLAVRMDAAERLVRALHARRARREAFTPEPRWLAMLGVDRTRFAEVMRALGYRSTAEPGAEAPAFAWAGTAAQPRPSRPRPASHSPFSILSTISGGVA